MLIYVKDVLQHWETRDVKRFLARMHGRELLVTNSVEHAGFSQPNSEIRSGGFRALNVMAPPFACSGEVLLDFTVDGYDRKNTVIVYGIPSALQPVIEEVKSQMSGGSARMADGIKRRCR